MFNQNVIFITPTYFITNKSHHFQNTSWKLYVQYCKWVAAETSKLTKTRCSYYRHPEHADEHAQSIVSRANLRASIK